MKTSTKEGSDSRDLSSSVEEVSVAEMESRSNLIGGLLRLFLHTHTRQIFLDEALKLVRGWLGVECAGIRVADEQGNVPYAVHTGFDKKFVDSEMWLSVRHHRCVCTRIITGEIEPQDRSVITSGGSFCSNNTLEFLNTLTEDEKTLFRGVCIQNGYLSVAVIPIRYGEKILGAIHFADHRANALPASRIAFIESSVTSLIGEGVYRFNVENQLQRNLETQTVLSSLLRYSLEDLTLEDILNLTLDLIYSSHSFSFGGKGAIFLIEDRTDDLCLKVSRGFGKAKKMKCERVAQGNCLCGNAARLQALVFAGSDEDHHHVKEPGQPKHSHYCIPIQTGKTLLGIINLYLEAHHRRDQKEEDFLTVIANALAGVIWRQRSEEKLRTLSRRLVNLQEEERRAIALELHDQIGQNLTGLKLMISQAGRSLDGQREQILSEAQSAVSELIVKVRDMSLKLRPSMLDDLGLLPTLVWMFEQSHANLKLKIDFRHSGLDKPLSRDVGIAAYRIIQEALTNVMRYAGVDRVAVDVWTNETHLHLRVEDKGRGFKIAGTAGGSSVGLQGMRERALLLGGNLTVESVPGIGTVVSAELPMSEKSDTINKPQIENALPK
jgi:signal transduction histidine kinase